MTIIYLQGLSRPDLHKHEVILDTARRKIVAILTSMTRAIDLLHTLLLLLSIQLTL